MKPAALVIGLLAFAAASHAEEAVFRGSIDGRIGFLMSIDTGADDARGAVIYDATSVSGLSLTGSLGPQGKIELKEVLTARNGDEKHTGAFVGTLESDRKAGSGVWTSADGVRSLPFELRRVATMQQSVRKQAGASVAYPHFDEPRLESLNRRLAAEAQKDLEKQVEALMELRDELKEEVEDDRLSMLTREESCAVVSVASDLVSLLCESYGYSLGAHGSTTFSGRSYAVDESGSIRELGLWDVVRSSSAATKALSSALIADLRNQHASLVIDGKIKDFVAALEKGEIPFTIMPAGLVFHFAPYAVASYSEGVFEVIVPNRALAMRYRSDGPLAARAERP